MHLRAEYYLNNKTVMMEATAPAIFFTLTDMAAKTRAYSSLESTPNLRKGNHSRHTG
jgi:hypothetical protein